MTIDRRKTGKFGAAPLLLAAVLGLCLPAAGAAVVADNIGSGTGAAIDFVPFTPANVDPSLVRKIASMAGADALRFTPAESQSRKSRVLTVAVRVDEATARAISVRGAIEGAQGSAGLGSMLAIAPTRYNLGIARGYQSFAKPASDVAGLPGGIREISMPDLSTYRSAESRNNKPSRFRPRIEVGMDNDRTPRSIDSLGEQIVDVGGAFRITRNLDVTAGVQLSQDLNHMTPLTDGVEDNQAVYVGTQLRF